MSFVDIAHRPPAPGELRRFIDRFGANSLVDTDVPAYRDAGLAYLRMAATEMAERLLIRPDLLRLPLVRSGNDLGGRG